MENLLTGKFEHGAIGGGRLSVVLILLVSLALFCACETTNSAARKEERNAREEEQARIRSAYLERLHEAEVDVWNTLHPLMMAAADYSAKETVGYIGAVFVTELFYPSVFEEEVKAEGFGSHITTLVVFPGSPAEAAGMRVGDRILAVNGVRAPRGGNAALFAAKRIKRLLIPGEANRFHIERSGEELELELYPEKGVYYAVVILVGDSVDLRTDGSVIWISYSLIESLRANEELPYVCGFALAKNMMRQSKQRGRNTFLGQLVDVAAMTGGVNTGGLFGGMGSAAYEAAYEVEADLIALYLLASTGFEIKGYPDFWEEVLTKVSKNGTLKPKEVERLQAMRNVIASIEYKREAEIPIFPEEYLSGDPSELKSQAEPEAPVVQKEDN